jgi:hypothetical protein
MNNRKSLSLQPTGTGSRAAQSQDYILVRPQLADVKDPGDDQKAAPEPDGKVSFDLCPKTCLAIRNALSRMGIFNRMKRGRAGRGKGLRPWSVDLIQQFVNTSSSGAAQAPVNNLQPASAVEWSTFAALFDMARCVACTLQVTVSAPSTNALPIEVGVSVDPMNVGSYSNAISTQLAAQHIYFVIGGSPDSIVTQTKSGLRVLQYRCPRGPQCFGASSSYVGSEWFNTNVSPASDAIVGFVKSYIDGASAGATVMTLNVIYHMQFRSRS